jgi:hypothetical protein
MKGYSITDKEYSSRKERLGNDFAFNVRIKEDNREEAMWKRNE